MAMAATTTAKYATLGGLTGILAIVLALCGHLGGSVNGEQAGTENLPVLRRRSEKSIAKAVSGLQRRQAKGRTEHADRSCTGSRRTGISYGKYVAMSEEERRKAGTGAERIKERCGGYLFAIMRSDEKNWRLR